MRVCNSSNLDGEVQNMEVMTPNSDYGNQYNEDYLNEFWEGDDFNFANGKRSRGRGRGKSRGIIQNVFGKNTIFNADERARRRERRQQRRDTRTGAKQLQSQAQLEIAKSMQDKSGDIALANALKGDNKKVVKQKGLSTGAIVGIVVGGLVVAGVIAYFVIKKKGSGAVAPTGTGIK